MIAAVNTFTKAHFPPFGPFFCHYAGIQEWCLNAILVDKGYPLGVFVLSIIHFQ